MLIVSVFQFSVDILSLCDIACCFCLPVQWSVSVEASVLVADPLSPYMAVVDNDQKCKSG